MHQGRVPCGGAAPLTSDERMGELDVLRGFALLGVFIVHFVGSAFYALPLAEADRAAFGESPLNGAALFVTEMFFYDKANTLFAVLFGMGFWVMMERLEGRGEDFSRIYLRRLLALMAIGALNLFLFFPGDVLHEYAALGFLLFFLRSLGRKAFLALGLVLAIGGQMIGEHLTPGAGAAFEAFEKIQAAAFEDGRYWNWAVETGAAHLDREILAGGFIGWGLYILGRFLLGAWIIRRGWIQRTAEFLPMIRRLALVTLPAGLVLEGGSMAVYRGWIDAPGILDAGLHALGAPLLAAGYALVLLLVFHSPRRGAVALFAPVGRMALSAYVLHGMVFTFLYFPFGLDLLGVIPPAGGLLIGAGLYAAMTLGAAWWLERFRFGPLEYLWRWMTYGRRPAFLRRRAVPGAA